MSLSKSVMGGTTKNASIMRLDRKIVSETPVISWISVWCRTQLAREKSNCCLTLSCKMTLEILIMRSKTWLFKQRTFKLLGWARRVMLAHLDQASGNYQNCARFICNIITVSSIFHSYYIPLSKDILDFSTLHYVDKHCDCCCLSIM